jgi:membrane protein DedA with SNARE-associated domain
MFQWLTDAVTAGPTTYLIVAAAAGGDVLFPLIPSETIVITAGVLAARGDLSLWPIIALAAVGAFAGDNACYWLGRKAGDPVARRLFRGARSRRRLEWAERTIRRHGPLIVIVGRCVPGGRTASTFAAGMLALRYGRFALADAAAAALWAAYASLLGYLGGVTFRDSLWKPLALSFGIAGAVTLATEIVRRVRGRQTARD